MRKKVATGWMVDTDTYIASRVESKADQEIETERPKRDKHRKKRDREFMCTLYRVLIPPGAYSWHKA